MTEPTRNEETAPPQPPPLDYARPQGGLPKGVQLTLGILMALVVMLPLAFFGTLALGMAGVFLGPIVGAAIVGSVAVILRSSDRTRAMAAGIWIGVGIAILVDGVCWLGIASM